MITCLPIGMKSPYSKPWQLANTPNARVCVLGPEARGILWFDRSLRPVATQRRPESFTINQPMRIVREGPESLPEYEKVPIAFEVRSRLRLSETGLLVEESVEPRIKNYDAIPEERPTAHRHRGCLGIFAAFDGDQRVGGTIVARDLPDFDIADGRSDIAVIIDLRVDSGFRNRGCGRHLFQHAADWARANNCELVRVETQDINVAACQFYERMGCALLSFEEDAYGPEVREARLYWERRL
jgi:GNAT superfamily N-acetyltransferase